MRLFAILLVTTAALIASPMLAQDLAKPIRVQVPVAAAPNGSARALTNRPLEPAVRVALPGARNAASWRATLNATSTRFDGRRAATGPVMPQPGIGRVNGRSVGVFEPGGDYEITGRGFGANNGSVLLRVAGRQIALRVNLWSDAAIYAHVPDDVAGLTDSAAELLVGPNGGGPLKSTKFGFRAARADINLPIDDAMFRHEGSGTARIGNVTVPLTAPPQTRRFDGKWYEVGRHVDDGAEKRCIHPGRDRISWPTLRNDFAVTSFWYERNPFRQTEGETPRGTWAFAWEGNSIRIDFGVIRYYVPRLVLVGGDGSCWARYKINLIATGPRGVSPL